MVFSYSYLNICRYTHQNQRYLFSSFCVPPLKHRDRHKMPQGCSLGSGKPNTNFAKLWSTLHLQNNLWTELNLIQELSRYSHKYRNCWNIIKKVIE